jgi:hypothetical protein
MNENANNGWQTAEAKAKNIAQTKALERKAPAGGLRFEACRCLIERGLFVDPSDVFVILRNPACPRSAP